MIHTPSRRRLGYEEELMRQVAAVLALVLSMLAVAVAQQPAATAEPSVILPKELARVLTDYETAWQAKDAAALARLFAEDGYVLPNGGTPVKGRAAIEKFYTGHGGPLSLRAIAFASDGNVGYILGGYASKAGEPDTGKFTLTLRKDTSGRWQIVSDMDSANQRPKPPQAGW